MHTCFEIATTISRFFDYYCCVFWSSKVVIKQIFRLGKLWHVQLYKQLLRLVNCLTDAAVGNVNLASIWIRDFLGVMKSAVKLDIDTVDRRPAGKVQLIDVDFRNQRENEKLISKSTKSLCVILSIKWWILKAPPANPWTYIYR